jgi:hypothetical protein
MKKLIAVLSMATALIAAAAASAPCGGRTVTGK